MKDPTLRSSSLPSSCRTRGQHANIVKTLCSCSNGILALSRYRGGIVSITGLSNLAVFPLHTVAFPRMLKANFLSISCWMSHCTAPIEFHVAVFFLLLQDSPEVWIWQVPRRQLRGVGSGTLWCHWCQGAMGTGFPGCEWTKYMYLISVLFYSSYFINFNVGALVSTFVASRIDINVVAITSGVSYYPPISL